jgi:hypothetical protein
VSVMRLFMDDLDLSNSGFGLRFVHSVLGKDSQFRKL